jgi:NAD(P)-dependent dehydrogenase (short-subunit alcohol dehydrogenase family)
MAQTARAVFGRIDALAVIAYREPDQRLLRECDNDLVSWRSIVDFNVFATLQVIKAVSEQMADGGSIAIVNSMTSDLPWPRIAPYAAAKAVLASLVRLLALEFGQRRIRINGMHAGGIANAASEKYIAALAAQNDRSVEKQRAIVAEGYPLGHMPAPDEYADSLVFLLSRLSRAVTGQAIHVNGGFFMR